MKKKRRLLMTFIILNFIFTFASATMIVCNHSAENKSTYISNSKIYNSKGKLVRNKIVTIKGKKYYANSKGIMVKNKIFKYKGKKYYAQKKGSLAQSKFFNYKVGKKTNKYYAKKNGSLAKGMFKVSNNIYYTNSKNVIYTSKKLDIGSKSYYAQKSGAFAKSKLIKKNGNIFYANEKGLLVKNKIQQYNGNYYYFGDDGTALRNQLIHDKLTGKKYYANADGICAKSKALTIDGKNYYATKDASFAISKKITINGNDYYFNSQGLLVTDKTITIDGVDYKADDDGTLTKIENNGDNENNNNETEECKHNWVADDYAYYNNGKPQFRDVIFKDDNGTYTTKNHEFCRECGLDLTQYTEIMNKYNNYDYDLGAYKVTHETYSLNSTEKKRSNYFGTIKDNNITPECPIYFPGDPTTKAFTFTFKGSPSQYYEFDSKDNIWKDKRTKIYDKNTAYCKIGGSWAANITVVNEFTYPVTNYHCSKCGAYKFCIVSSNAALDDVQQINYKAEYEIQHGYKKEQLTWYFLSTETGYVKMKSFDEY